MICSHQSHTFKLLLAFHVTQTPKQIVNPRPVRPIPSLMQTTFQVQLYISILSRYFIPRVPLWNLKQINNNINMEMNVLVSQYIESNQLLKNHGLVTCGCGPSCVSFSFFLVIVLVLGMRKMIMIQDIAQIFVKIIMI